MTTSKDSLNIEEGTVSFWVEPHHINFSDDTANPLVNLSPPNGSIFILKDNDRKLKLFHVYMNKGRTDVEAEVSKLDPDQKHMFAFTWSVSEGKISIYIDGKLAAESPIKYNE